MSVRTRFAPSPTGFLHVGSARTALFAWLYARQQKGEFILRIEDTDKAREVEGSIDHIIESLTWLGVEWDEGPDKKGRHAPYLQSERLDSYKKYAHMLIEKGLAYPDPYTPEELETFRAKAEEEHRPFLFRDHRPEEFGTWDQMTALRFKVPEVKKYTWTDMVRGELSAGEEALDDFILIKADGYPTYNFAHIIDDHEMEITHIMRGEEFISSTPKFLSLYEALEFTPPVLATMPVILGKEGTKKLSKRDGAKDLLDYRTEGILPEAMMNFLALLGWHPLGDEEVLSYEDLLAQFSPERIQKAGAHFDEDKLLHLNREWMRKLSDSEYVSHIAYDAAVVSMIDNDVLLRVVPILKERARSFAEAREMLRSELSILYTKPSIDSKILTRDCSPESVHIHLVNMLAILKEIGDGSNIETLKNDLMPYADSIAKEDGGRGAALWPLRYALSGAERSPDPFTLIYVLGKDEATARISAAISLLSV